MNEINDGGPAFPNPIAAAEQIGFGTVDEYSHGKLSGMSLRDYFAAKAMAAYIGHLSRTGQTVSKCYSEIADESYRIADAMLAAREGKEGA